MTGKIRLTGIALTSLRIACFCRDEFRCSECGAQVTWYSGHMAHIISRGAGGYDTLDNTTTKCALCHLVEEHNPKSVRSKQ